MYEFGPYRLHLSERKLLRDGEPVLLQPKTFDLLVYLVEHSGRLIRKEELLESVWQDSHVEEANLAVHVSQLRKALSSAGDDFIITVPKHGYRFRAEVKKLSPSPVQPQSFNPSTHPVSKLSPGWDPAWKFALGLIVVGFGLYWGPSLRGRSLWNPMPLTATRELELAPALSPDGKRLVYSLRGAYHSKPDPSTIGLRLRQIGSDKVDILTTQSDYNAVWSPGGREIAFIRFAPKANMMDETLLVIRSIPEGSEKVLTRLQYRGPLPGPGITYTPDGKWLLTSIGTGFFDGSSPRRLVAVSREKGEVRDLLEPPQSALGDSNPVLSPTGDRLAFCRCKSLNSCDLFEVRLNGLTVSSPPIRLTQVGMAEFRAAYLPDGSLIYPRGPLHARVFWRVGTDWLGRQVNEQLSSPGIDVGQPTIAPSPNGGSRLVYATSRVDLNIWSMDTAPNSEPRLLIGSNHPDQTPAVSPDGRSIAFTSTRGGTWEIWISDANGKQARQLTHMGPYYSRYPTWSADAKWIAFESRGNGEPHLFLAEVATGKVKQITSGEGAYTDPVWTHDGKWIYYTSNRSGRPDIYRMRAPDGWNIDTKSEQITLFGGTHPQISPDGKTLLFTGVDLIAYYMTIGEPEQINKLPEQGEDSPYFIFPPAAGRGKTAFGLLYTSTGAFWGRIDLETQAIHRFRNARFDRNMTLAISPDEKQLLWTQTDGTESDLVIMDQFRY